MRIPEFYPERQGRPATPITSFDTRDLETGQSALYSSYITLRGEYMELLALTEKLLKELINLSKGIRDETAQSTLHLAKLSGEKITKKDVQ